MGVAHTICALNRLLAIHCQSLPVYLSFTSPWMNRRDELAQMVLAHMVEDQQSIIERIGALISDLGGTPHRGRARDYTR